MSKDPGEWYDKHREECERIYLLIQEVKKSDPINQKLLEYLESELEFHRHVGD